MLRYDLLGAIRYQDEALKGVKKGSAIAVLDRYFLKGAKEHNAFYERILTHKKDLTLVAVGSWAGSSHEYDERHLKRAMRLCKRLYRIGVRTNTLDKIWVNPFLEHKNGKTFIESSLRKLKAAYPDLTFINSYIKGGYSDCAIPEVHNRDFLGAPHNPYIWSYDGVPTTRENIQYYKRLHKDALMFGLWDYWCNGLEGEDDTTSPLKRTNWPTVQRIRQIGRLY